jgi:hypothetical protein
MYVSCKQPELDFNVSVLQKATKWSERRDAVAELTKLASVRKIANGDFSEVSRILKKVSRLCCWWLSFFCEGYTED